MFVLFAFIFSLVFSLTDLIFIKNYQLEKYEIKKYLKNISKFNFSIGNKNKLVFTNRAKRLIFSNFLIKLIIFLIIFAFLNKIWLFFAFFCLFFVLSPVYIILSFALCLPVENLIKKRYIKKAKKKLKNCRCKKIGITGSFGKTSTKDILYQILSQQFDVCATPKSFNTPMGVCKTVLEDLKETDEFFIVEMGARHCGDIDFLAKFVGVDFGIITPIGNCHLETFGNVENIKKTKYELCENSDIVVFNGKSKHTKRLYEKYGMRKYLVCDKKGFAYAKNIISGCDGSKFTLVVDGKEIECTTKLLGKANIDNIVVASSMAYILGEDLLCINRAIEKIKQIPHRLELIKGHVNVIDDSFNSNFDGFCEALEIMKNFPGKKIVVSPGMIELGKEQLTKNYEIGKKIASVCDFFVIMNEFNKKFLLDGARDGGLEREKIFFAKTRQQQKEILKNILSEGDCVLFENDFPDNIR